MFGGVVLYYIFRTDDDGIDIIQGNVLYIVYNAVNNTTQKLRGIDLLCMMDTVGLSQFNNIDASISDYTLMPVYVDFLGIVMADKEFVLVSSNQIKAIWSYGTYATVPANSLCYVSRLCPLVIYPGANVTFWGACSYADFIRMYCVR